MERSNDRLGGAWTFRGTRVPLRALFENLASGATVDDFVAWFQGVTRSQVSTVLEHLQAGLESREA